MPEHQDEELEERQAVAQAAGIFRQARDAALAAGRAIVEQQGSHVVRVHPDGLTETIKPALPWVKAAPGKRVRVR